MKAEQRRVHRSLEVQALDHAIRVARLTRWPLHLQNPRMRSKRVHHPLSTGRSIFSIFWLAVSASRACGEAQMKL